VLHDPYLISMPAIIFSERLKRETPIIMQVAGD